ncbi:hypothetical protein [Arthrobacter sp. zg-Y1110]|uniref:hypothetical protein n=1 Tax=Arthrobacter sp. zg-Y1110 TaxID=2886932 RepID=UPI001D152FE1|nr:hypothetical protein [Arthrobacter sp. zg-Y1110]MCC3292523.1 hypothetical protein [Arthrobacter sp. zg-Y1110]UWX87045.1 hypothetical protein N2K99_16980 [Arthrobacter sp. zg-Y1110]
MKTENPAPAAPDAPTPEPIVLPPASPDGKIDLARGWDAAWASLTNGYPGLGSALAFVGVAIVVLSLMQWAWASRRGRGQGQAARPVWGAMIIGSLLTAPTVIVPLLLGVLSTVINIVISLFRGAMSM